MRIYRDTLVSRVELCRIRTEQKLKRRRRKRRRSSVFQSPDLEQVEAIEIHHFRPGLGKVADEFVFSVDRAINLSYSA